MGRGGYRTRKIKHTQLKNYWLAGSYNTVVVEEDTLKDLFAS